MSGAALGWAWKQPVPVASAKFVLVLLADQTTGDLAFMAVNTIAQRTGLDRKTVMASIARLAEWGLIEDTGERRGRTGSVPVYRLLMNESLFDAAPYSKAASSTRTGTSTETGTASEAVPKTYSSGTTFPAKRYQKRDTDPELLTQEPDPRETTHARAPTPGALATRAMIDAGLSPASVNPSHPELLGALAEGVTATELADVVRELLARFASRGTGPPPMTYVIRTAVDRRKTAAHQQGTPDAQSPASPPRVQGPSQGRARSAVGRQLEGIRRRRAREAAGAQVPPRSAAGAPD